MVLDFIGDNIWRLGEDPSLIDNVLFFLGIARSSPFSLYIILLVSVNSLPFDIESCSVIMSDIPFLFLNSQPFVWEIRKKISFGR